jgi:UDP-3-O-[3-hydroxymyristoyl] glucosamine N-acyltransferase
MGLDGRFYTWRENTSLADLLKHLSLHVPGAPDVTIKGLAPSAAAGEGGLCFFEGKALRPGEISGEGCVCLVREDLEAEAPGSAILLPVARPRLVFADMARHLTAPRPWPTGEAQVSPRARIEDGALIGTGAIIGDGAMVGAGTLIGPGSVIGPGVCIGRDCEIGAHVSMRCTLVGDHVTILSGTRIGEAGFGTIAGSDGAEDMPQFGRVIIQDHVSIGANCCIDRGAFDDTMIGARTKIDNLCQIGHNVRVGRNVVMAAFAGLSGTVTLEDGAMLGGRVGIADHVRIGAGARLAADAAIMKDVPAGETWGGTPARPFRNWMRETAWLSRQANRKAKT